MLRRVEEAAFLREQEAARLGRGRVVLGGLRRLDVGARGRAPDAQVRAAFGCERPARGESEVRRMIIHCWAQVRRLFQQ